jgi:hypothetical protein
MVAARRRSFGELAYGGSSKAGPLLNGHVFAWFVVFVLMRGGPVAAYGDATEATTGAAKTAPQPSHSRAGVESTPSPVPIAPKDKSATDMIVRILQKENGQLLIQIPQRHNEWWQDPSAWSPFVALLIAIVGWYLASRQLNRQLEENRHSLELQLEAERAQKRQEFDIQERRKRAELIREKLNSFYRPYRQLSETNKLLHQALKGRQKDPNFRTLVSLLEAHQFTEDDTGLIKEIV